jgi:hypothetical protein
MHIVLVIVIEFFVVLTQLLKRLFRRGPEGPSHGVRQSHERTKSDAAGPTVTDPKRVAMVRWRSVLPFGRAAWSHR